MSQRMFIVMGGTGHVGSAVAANLLAHGERVTIVTHKPDDATHLRDRGASVVAADVNDPGSLRRAFALGQRAFLLNPPADTSTDTDAVERATVANILTALDGAGLEKVVAESTAGAQPGERIGDLSVLWELEKGLRARTIPAAVNRAAYYMSNWDAQLDSIRKTGTLSSLYPADMKLPMVAPRDLGKIGAERLISSLDDTQTRNVEGPERYSATDVARAFSNALGRPVDVAVTPRHEFRSAYRALGFSEAAADSYARMTEVSLDRGFDSGDESIRGETTIDEYISHLISPR